MPGWMAGIEEFAPGKAAGFGLVMAGANPKNLLLAVGAGSAPALVGGSGTAVVVSLVVFVLVASLTIAGPVLYYLLGGQRAKTALDSVKGWLVMHNDAVMMVLFLVFGVDLIAKGIPAVSR
jgi:Sap, sulfolipid-1-addressing protein